MNKYEIYLKVSYAAMVGFMNVKISVKLILIIVTCLFVDGIHFHIPICELITPFNEVFPKAVCGSTAAGGVGKIVCLIYILYFIYYVITIIYYSSNFFHCLSNIT